eukprot:scaffold15058_cov76-Amphora_coffeaeformis.AAC.1
MAGRGSGSSMILVSRACGRGRLGLRRTWVGVRLESVGNEEEFVGGGEDGFVEGGGVGLAGDKIC